MDYGLGLLTLTTPSRASVEARNAPIAGFSEVYVTLNGQQYTAALSFEYYGAWFL